jgi:hypothetical protein
MKKIFLLLLLCLFLLSCTTTGKQSGDQGNKSSPGYYDRTWELMKAGRFGGGW